MSQWKGKIGELRSLVFKMKKQDLPKEDWVYLQIELEELTKLVDSFMRFGK